MMQEPTMQDMAAAEQQAAPEQQPNPGQQAPAGGGDDDIEEVRRGLQGLTEIFYKNEQVSDEFVKMIRPDDPVGSITEASILAVTELDKKINLSERVIAPIGVIAAGELMELAEAAHNVTLDEKQQQQVVMATFEGLLGAYGMNEEAAVDFAGSTSPEEQEEAVSTYQSAMPGA